MLIHLFLNFIVLILAVIFIVLVTIKRKCNNNIKLRFILTLILTIIFIFKTFIAIILGMSELILIDILGSILWGFNAVGYFFYLKKEKKIEATTFYCNKDDKDIIDID